MMRTLRGLLVVGMLLPAVPVGAPCCPAKSNQKAATLAASCDCCHSHACMEAQPACESEALSHDAAIVRTSASANDGRPVDRASLGGQRLASSIAALQGLAPPRRPLLSTVVLAALILPLRL